MSTQLVREALPFICLGGAFFATTLMVKHGASRARILIFCVFMSAALLNEYAAMENRKIAFDVEYYTMLER